MRVNRKFVVAVVSLAVLALVFGLVGTVAPPLADEAPPTPQQESSSSSPSGSVGHFQNPPTYDSGWVDIGNKTGHYFTLKHSLNTTDVVVDISGKQSLDPVRGVPDWKRTYGGANVEEAYSMVQTVDGGYALAGSTYDAFGDRQYDFRLVKVDAAGNAQWNKTYGGKADDIAYSLVQTNDGGYALAGWTLSYVNYGDSGDMWLVKTDAAGNAQWNKTYGSSPYHGLESAHCVLQTDDGGYAIAGTHMTSGCWMVKTDAAGNAQWNNTYVIVGGYGAINSVVQTDDGGYAIAGSWTPIGTGNTDFMVQKADAAGNRQWYKTYGGANYDSANSVVQTMDGGYALAGYTDSYGVARDFWMVKTDAAGNAQWNNTYGGTNSDVAYSVIETNDGGYAIAGETGSYGAGSLDFWLVKVDAIGNVQWSKTYGGASSDSARSVVQIDDGGYVLAGSTNSFGAGFSDFWLVKVQAETDLEHQRYLGGTILSPGWSRTYGGTGDDWAQSVVQTLDGGYAIAGYSNSPGGAGDYDFWLVKTDAVGNVQWSKTYGGTNTDKASSVIQTSDGGYALVGTTYSYGVGGDAWMVKTDAAGNAQWNKTYGGTNSDWGLSAVQTVDGDYALAGTTYSFGVGGDFWLVKTYANGYMHWNKTYGGANYDVANSLVQTSDGGYALAGHTESFGAGGDFWLVKTDAYGIMAWNKTYGGANDDVGRSLVQTSDEGYAIAGETSSYGASFYDFCLVKTDAAGNLQWNKTYGGANYDSATSVVQTVDGGYALAGFYSYGPSGDFWLVKTDAVGDLQWSKTYGGANLDNAYSVVETNDGGYALAGYTLSYGSGGKDFLLIKTDVELGLSETGLTNNAITLYRGKTDTYWNYVRVRVWIIKEPSWIYGDINMDGLVDSKDLYIIGRNYGKTFSLLSLGGIVGIAGIQTVKTKRKRSKQPSYIS